MIAEFIGAVAAFSLLAGVSWADDYPEREVLGVVMWGAGGATDTVARAVNPAAEEALGKPIVMLNKSGGAGAISTAFVNAAPAYGSYAVIRLGDQMIHLTGAGDDEETLRATANHTSFFVDMTGVDTYYADVLAAKPPTKMTDLIDRPWGTREFHLYDLDHALIRIGEDL